MRNNTKSSKQKRAARKPVPRIHRLGMGFPKQLEVVHKYVDEFTLTSTSGVMANYRFRATGMFDPNHTAAGHQPSYYDVFSEVYDHWIVTQALIELTILPPTTASTPSAIGIATNDDTTTGPTSFVAYEESSDCKVTFFTPDSGSPSKLSLMYRLNDTFPFDSSRGFWGSVAADPSEETIFNVFLQAVDQTNTAAAFIVAKITYTAVWFELKDLVVS